MLMSAMFAPAKPPADVAVSTITWRSGDRNMGRTLRLAAIATRTPTTAVLGVTPRWMLICAQMAAEAAANAT